MEETIKCTKCGEDLKPHWKICPNCQQPVQGQVEKCAFCGEELEKDMVICPSCKKTREQAKAAVGEVSNQNSAKNENTDEHETGGKYFIDKNKFFSDMQKHEQEEKQALELEKQKEENIALHKKFRSLIKSSREHIMEGKLDIALREAKDALKINSTDHFAAQPHSLIADIYQKKGKLEDAINEINIALSFNDQYWYAHCVLAKIFYIGNDYEQMREHVYIARQTVNEKELIENSLSDIPNLNEIIEDLEEKDREKYNDENYDDN
ncbi:hypothetical protein R84B8_01105 [Treponema sp. R8-4-B8]